MHARCGLLAAATIAAVVLFVGPASAKGGLEFEVSGPDMPGRVLISGEAIGSIRGWVLGSEDPARPASLGLSHYFLDVYPTSPEVGPDGRMSRRRASGRFGRWTFYPEAGGAIAEDGSWIPFSPALNSLINRALREASGGHVRVVPLLGGMAFAGAMIGVALLRMRRRELLGVPAANLLA